MSRRRRMPEYVDNHERWLISYADFITLLFAFFVVMYSTSRVSTGGFRVLSESILDAFDLPRSSMDQRDTDDAARSLLESTEDSRLTGENPVMIPLRRAADGLDEGDVGAAVVESGPGGIRTDEPVGDTDAPTPVDQVKAIATALEDTLGELVAPDVVGIRRSPRWLEISIPSKLVFPTGSRVFLNDAVPLMARIAESLQALPNEIDVQAHTDDQPIRNGLFTSNWELSAARAAAIAGLLVDAGIDPARLSATGYAGSRPIDDNTTDAGREANTRLILQVRAEGIDRVQGAALQQVPGNG